MRPFLLILLTFLTACQEETQIDIANQNGILIVGNSAEPKALDPQIVTGVPEAKILTALFEGLIGDHPTEDDTPLPGVATSWEPNEDFTVWTFKLNPKAKWSDGVPLTSKDFYFAYHRILHPSIAAPYAPMLHFIKGAEAFNRGEIKDFSEVGVETPDPHTLRVTLREPVPFLPSLTRHYTWFPVPEHIVNDPAHYRRSPFEPFTDWATKENFVGNGPFKLKEWVFNSHLEVEKNPHYWDAETVKLNGIRFLPIENSYTETRAFLAGQLHTTYKLPPDQLERVRETYPQFLREEPYVGTVFYRLNTTQKPLDQEKVRQALALAIDREALARSVYIGFQPAHTFTPKMGDYDPPATLFHNPEKARKLLAEAGFPGGKGFPRLSVLITRPEARATNEAVQAMWRDELGIIVDIKNLDWGSYITAQQNLDFDIAAAGWIGDYLDPTTFLGMWTEGNGNNNSGWSSQAFEQKLRDAALEPQPDDRYQTLMEAEAIFMKELPAIPIAFYARLYLHRPEVQGWDPLLLDNHPWKFIHLNPEATQP